MIGLHGNRNRQLLFYKIMSVMLIVCVLTAGFGLRSAEAYGGWRAGGISGEGPGFPGEEPFPPGEPAEESGEGFVSVSAGPAHVLAVRADGSLWAWGSNISGELGIGTADTEAHPEPIRIGMTPGGNRFIQAAAGGYTDETGIPRGFSIALDDSGHVWVWGDNGFGQLGLGDTESRHAPERNEDLNHVSDVYAGGKFAAALSQSRDGYVYYDFYTWGNNDQGQLGRSSDAHPMLPWPVSLNRLDPIVEAALGDAHVLVIQESDGVKTLKGWGYNAHKQLSDAENEPAAVVIPTELTVPGGIEGGELLHVAAGGNHSAVAIGRFDENDQYSEEVWTFGANDRGQLGTGTNDAGTAFHMSYSTNSSIEDLAAGYDFTMLVSGQDDMELPESIYGWGDSSSGQLGFSQAAPVSGSDFAGSSPLMTMPLNGIAAGLHFALGIQENGELCAWGTNTYGQLGIGISGEETVAPERVHFPTAVTGASIEEWGEIREFGAPASYQLQFTAKSGIAPGDKITLQIPQAFMSNPEVMPFEPSDIEIQTGGGTPYTPSEVFAGTARTLEIPLSQEAEPGTTVIVNLKNDKLIVPLVEDSYSFLLYTSADAYPVNVKSTIGKIIRFSATASNYLVNSQAQYHFELITRFDVDAGQSLHFYMPSYTISENGLIAFYKGQRLPGEDVIIDTQTYDEFSIVVPNRIPAGQKVTFDIVHGLWNPGWDQSVLIGLSIPSLGGVERVVQIGGEPPFRFYADQEGLLATGSLDVAVNAEGFEISDYSPYKVRFSADEYTWPDQGWQDLQPILSHRLGTGEEGLRTIFVQPAEKEGAMRTFAPYAVSIYYSGKTQLTGLSVSKSGGEYIPTVEPFEPERSAYTVNLNDSQSGELLIEPLLKEGAHISAVGENAQLENGKISVDLAALPIGLTPVEMTVKATDPQYGEVENKITVNVNIRLPLTSAQLDFRSGEEMPAYYGDGAKLQVKLTAPNALFNNDRIRVEVPASFLVTRTTEWNATAYVRQNPGIEDSTPVEVIVKPDSVNREFIVELTGAESVLVPPGSELTLLLDKEPDTPGGAGYPVVLPDSIGEYEASVSTTRNLPSPVNIVVPADSPQDVTVTPGTDMAAAVNVEYAIAFISPNTLDPVNDPITISFPVGYVLPETMDLGTVSVNNTVPAQISINEEERKISIFTDESIRVGDPVAVVFDESAGIQNPAVPDIYSIDVSTELTLNSTSVDVTIVGKVAAPTASLETGAIVAPGTTVTLSSETAGAELRYTLNGAMPTSESPWVGSGESVILIGEPNQVLTLKVIALKEGMTASEVSTFTYTIQDQAAAPTASLETGATVAPGTTVTLTSETAGSELHYTWDGSTPTSESPWVGSGESVMLTGEPNAAITLKVIALKEGMTASEVSTFTYTIQAKVAAPTASLETGAIVAPGSTVTLSSETAGAELRYTLNGAMPTEASDLYDSQTGITLTGEPNTAITLKVFALKEGMTASEVSTFTYTIQDQAAPPTASVETGVTVAPGTTVTLSSETAGSELHYTWDGSTPTSESPWVGSGESVMLTGEPNAAIILKVIALKEGMTASEVSTFTYTIQDQAAAPTASLETGAIVAPGSTVTLSSETAGAELRYTLNGAMPTEASDLYDSQTGITLTGEPNETITLKVIALKEGMTASEVLTFTYTIQDQAAAPTAWLETGAIVAPGTTVKLSSETAGAELRYTLNGAMPTEASDLYDSQTGITLIGEPNEVITLKVIALKEGLTASEVTTFTYTIQDQAAAPTASPVNGATVAPGTTVTLSSETAGAELRYTLNGALPTEASDLYDSQTGITLTDEPNAAITLKVIALKEGMTASEVSTFTYTIQDQAAAPTASPENGAIVAPGTTVTLNSETSGAELHYTWDGSMPTSESPWVGSGESVTLAGEPNAAITLKVIALKEGLTASEVSTFTYTIQAQAAAPTASLVNGTIVAPGTTVLLSSETIGAKLHYTLDGSTPTSSSPWVGSGENVTLSGEPNQTLTLKVIALKEGMTASEVAVFQYTIRQVLSDNNYLSELALLGFDEAGDEKPILFSFDSDMNDYQVTVDHDIERLLVSPKLEDPEKAILQISVNDEQASVTENVYLEVGVTNIAIVVTAENNETRSYMLNVTRSGPSNADLIGITLHGALSAPSGNEISLKVDAAQPSLEWLVQRSDPLATYAISQISGPTVTDIVYSPSNELVQVSGILEGEYRFRIVVTAQDFTEKTYEVILAAVPEPLIGKFAFADVTENTITLMLSAAMNDDVQLDPQKFAIVRDGQTFAAATVELDSGDLSGYSLRITFDTLLNGDQLTLKLADGAIQLQPGKRNIAQMLEIKGDSAVAAIRAEMDTDGDGVRIDDVVKYLNRMHDVTGDDKIDRNDIRFLLMQIGK